MVMMVTSWSPSTWSQHCPAPELTGALLGGPGEVILLLSRGRTFMTQTLMWKINYMGIVSQSVLPFYSPCIVSLWPKCMKDVGYNTWLEEKVLSTVWLMDILGLFVILHECLVSNVWRGKSKHNIFLPSFVCSSLGYSCVRVTSAVFQYSPANTRVLELQTNLLKVLSFTIMLEGSSV